MRRFIRVLATSLLVLCWLGLPAYSDQLPASKPEEVGISSQGLDQLDAYVQKVVDGKELSGAVFMMSRHGKVVHQKAIGLMDLEAKKPMRSDAIFRIASMTKPVTSVGIMILCDDGRLALDDPVSKYIPEFKQPRVLVTHQPLKTIPAKREITIRDLLRHTAGLTYVWNPELGPLYRQAGIICGLTPEQLTLEENIKRLAKMPLLFSPGDKWEYGLSTDVLGRVVEVVSGMSLEEFCQKRVFLPLGMKDTHFRLPKEKYHRLPIVYLRDGKGPMRPLLNGKQEIAMGTLPYAADFPYQGKSRYLSGGAGLCSTASDYLRFCQMLLNGGQWNGKRLLREETVRAMRSNQIRDLSIGTPGQKFGLGFAVAEKAEDQGQQLVGSYAWGGFFGTLFWIVPKEDWILVVMLQQVGGPEPSRRWPNELIRLAAAAVGKSPNQPPSQAMLIEPETLQAHLHQPGLRLLDTRPKAEYLKGHIPGATWVDVKRWQQLGCKEGGLRDALAWGKEVGGLGIKGDSAVVVYGSTPPDTARIWWTLKYLGVKNVSILNGGWPLWIKEKRLTDTISPVVQAAKFEPKFQSDLLEEADSLKKSLGTGRVTVVDARSKEEFTGKEVRGKRGGHIPGARHLEWKDLLAADGRFKSPEQLRALFQQRGIHPEQTAVTC